MSEISMVSGKRPQSTVNQSGPSMHFWGICCESGKQYAQVVGQRFRITMAVLDPSSYDQESEKTVSLIVIRGGIEYLLCVLKHDEIHQVNLNLIFDKGENVKFYINGQGKVYLSGYQLTDSEGDVMNDENGYLCPLVEVKSKRKKSSKDTESTKQKTVTKTPLEEELEAKSIKDMAEEKKTAWAYLTEASFNEDESSDDDFSVSDEESDDDDEEFPEDIEDGELEDITQNETDIGYIQDQIVQNSYETRKRKKMDVLPLKRARRDSNKSSSSAENEDIICIGDNGSDKETSNVKSCLRNTTPMPKNQVNDETSLSEKKSKKKKKKKERLSEISNISDTSITGDQANRSTVGTPKTVPNTPKAALNTPKSTQNSPKESKNPIVKLEGGVEIQDVVLGKGPIAAKGKMLHVFFVGRLQDKTVFDSRLPGKKPFSFKLGCGQVIKGWEVAFQGMRVGGKRKIKVPPNMAYGSTSRHGIPPSSTLFFVVELQSVC